MSKLSSLVLGVVSGAAMFGAIQYASGNDLRGTLTDRDRADSSVISADVLSSGIGVNRTAKSDRASVSPQSNRNGQTLSFQIHGVADTSVLVRIAKISVIDGRAPVTAVLMNASINAKPQRASVACEPPVSVLTDVAKLLQPGRCVT